MASNKTATKIPGVTRVTKQDPAVTTYTKKVAAEFKRRDRKIELTDAEKQVVAAWLAAGKEADLCASEIISARDYKDMPQAPIRPADEVVSEAVPTSQRDGGLFDNTPETSPPLLQKYSADLGKTQAEPGGCYISFPTPLTRRNAEYYCAYYSKVLRTVMEVRKLGTNEVLSTYSGVHLKNFVRPEGEKPTLDGAKTRRTTNGDGTRKARAPGRYSLTNPDTVATEAFAMAQRPEGASRTDLCKLDPTGRVNQWPWVIQQLAKHRKLAFSEEKINGDRVFRIATA